MLSRKNMPLDAMRHASCFTLKRVAALLLVGMLPAVCPAEEYVDLQTDRDAFTPSTHTVKPGTVLTEGSYVYIDNRSGPPTKSYPELLCRIGARDRIEWRIGGEQVVSEGAFFLRAERGRTAAD